MADEGNTLPMNDHASEPHPDAFEELKRLVVSIRKCVEQGNPGAVIKATERGEYPTPDWLAQFYREVAEALEERFLLVPRLLKTARRIEAMVCAAVNFQVIESPVPERPARRPSR